MPKIPSCLIFLLVVLLAHPAAATVLPDGSGVLIAPEWVLTAGHVTRGVSARSPRVEIDGRECDVARIFVHPEWRDMGPHDVGLMRLKRPVQDVTPAELYAGDDDRIFFDFDQGDEATELEGVSGPGGSGGPALLERDGKLVTKYVETYNGNDDAAMSAFIAAHFAEHLRAKRTEQEHIDLYRRLYDEYFGRLNVQQVIRKDETGLTVLFSSANGPMAEFTFEVEPGETTRMAGIRVAVVDVREGGRGPRSLHESPSRVQATSLRSEPVPWV